MHREVLQALLPAVIALAVALVLLTLVVKLSGAKLSLGRLRRLHRCQQGAVQSLSFVLTLPMFVMLVMFIIQVSQLMVGIIVVHYAAFAAGRAAIVWAPAHFRPTWAYTESFENELPDPIRNDNPIVVSFLGTGISANSVDESTSYKLNKVFGAAVLALTPISPSHPYCKSVWCSGCSAQSDVLLTAYQQFVPTAVENPKIPTRLGNKLAYSHWNTSVQIRFIAKDYERGPTYNPRVLRVVDGTIATDDSGEYIRDWNRREVGWQDPIVIRVTHDFALLPGPGRFLARYVVGGDGRIDDVAPRIQVRAAVGDDPFIEPVHTTSISASVTLINEGFKPLMSYEQTAENLGSSY